MPSDDEDYPEWYKRRRRPFSSDPFFGDIDRMFSEMERMMEEEFKKFSENVPKDYVKERKLPDGSIVKEFGPFVYGYSMRIGPDGKPEIQEFGNIKKSLKGPEVKEEREPLVDIVETDSEVRVVAELPGVEKTDIKLHGTEDSLTISVDTPQYKYYKDVALPVKVKVKEAKSTYKNGVLEVVFPKAEALKQPKGERIDIG
ncbi:Hsp20/alpha crystallin family protein [Candidatus Bathyarchaeota archaeon A05DMB-2]|jgi:HSP20 family protein|nr:Hsp20/alpha crystallin family protein [Candidatus Bathyarchaeota archaeon A05DMB-2]